MKTFIFTLSILFFSTKLLGEQLVAKPKLNPGEFTTYFKEKYHIFRIREYKKLDLSTNCFANSKSAKKKIAKPKCQAFEVAQIKVNDVISKDGGTNLASLHCKRMMGDNLIAYDHLNNQYDYCRFPDDSLVDSWTMFNHAFVSTKK